MLERYISAYSEGSAATNTAATSNLGKRRKNRASTRAIQIAWENSFMAVGASVR
jgi:hypothetical protein